MRPLAGDYAFLLFAFGLFKRVCIRGIHLPLSTAYNGVRGHGLRVRCGQDFKRRRSSTGFIRCSSLAGRTVLVLARRATDQCGDSFASAERLLLPVVIIRMLLLINRSDLMGEHKNSGCGNVIAWEPALL